MEFLYWNNFSVVFICIPLLEEISTKIRVCYMLRLNNSISKMFLDQLLCYCNIYFHHFLIHMATRWQSGDDIYISQFTISRALWGPGAWGPKALTVDGGFFNLFKCHCWGCQNNLKSEYFRIWGYMLYVEHISCFITNCGQHQWIS